MTTKLKLVAVALLSAVLVAVFVYANTRPAIPAETMQPDLDPATATPAEWRAQAERIVAAASAVMPLVSEELDRDGIPHKDKLRHYLGVLYGDLGDPEAVARLSDERATADGRRGGWVMSASAPAAIGDVETVERLVQLAPNDDIRDRLRLELARTYANANDPDRALELYRQPEISRLTTEFPINRSLSAISASLARAGMQQQARELLQNAEARWSSTGDPARDSNTRRNLAEFYIIAGDLASARRHVDQFDASDYTLSEFAEQQARQLEFDAARATRDSIEDDSYRAFSCANAARHLALTGEEYAARELFSEAIAIAAAMEPEWGYRDTMTNETVLIHTARRQHEAGFDADAAETARQAFELIQQQHDNEMDKALALAELLELLLKIEQPDLAKEVYDRAATIVSASDDKNSDVWEALIALGRAASKLNMPDASAEHFAAALDTAINMEPKPDQRSEPAAAFVLRTAVAQSESRQQDAASEAFTLATRMHRQAEESDRDDIRDGIAQGLVLSGRITAALYFAQQIKDPYDRAWLLCELAAIAIDKAKSDKYWAIHGE